eukprot:1191246-Prorocentrum_minimum.AAC.2
MIAGVLTKLNIQHAYDVDYVYVTVSMNFGQDQQRFLSSLAVEAATGDEIASAMNINATTNNRQVHFHQPQESRCAIEKYHSTRRRSIPTE